MLLVAGHLHTPTTPSMDAGGRYTNPCRRPPRTERVRVWLVLTARPCCRLDSPHIEIQAQGRPRQCLTFTSSADSSSRARAPRVDVGVATPPRRQCTTCGSRGKQGDAHLGADSGCVAGSHRLARPASSSGGDSVNRLRDGKKRALFRGQGVRHPHKCNRQQRR